MHILSHEHELNVFTDSSTSLTRKISVMSVAGNKRLSGLAQQYRWVMLCRFIVMSISFSKTENVFDLLLEKTFMITILVKRSLEKLFFPLYYLIVYYTTVHIFCAVQCNLQIFYIIFIFYKE